MIGILNAYLFDDSPGSYQLAYEPMFREYLSVVMPDTEFKTYQVGLGEFPASPTECEGWIITGSSKSAYDEDSWIVSLKQFIRDSHKEKVKLLGICFGHQLIAQALGGETKNSPKGWGVGVRPFSVEKFKPWMTPESTPSIQILFSHQDQVETLPETAQRLATDEFCPNQMYSIGNSVFSMQGHPEFTKEFAKQRMDTRIEKLGQQTYEKAVSSLNLDTDHLIVGQWIKNFFNS